MPWLNNRKVNALWSNHQKSNVHGHISGSWRKFHDANDDATTNFAILAAHAKGHNRNVNVFVQNGRVREMYVW